MFNTIFGLTIQEAQDACFRRVGEALKPEATSFSDRSSMHVSIYTNEGPSDDHES